MSVPEIPDLHWATVWEAVADSVGDADAVVQGTVRRSWADLERRAARLAGALADAGLVVGSKVAQFLYNSPEYVESSFAILKGRGVPVNVNYRYLDDELAYLLDNSDAEALIFHASLAGRVARVRDRAPGIKLWVAVEDPAGPGAATGSVEGAVRYEDLVAGAHPAPRIARPGTDPVMTYTGGTTGMPKGVTGPIGPGVLGLLTAVPPMVGEAPVTGAAGAGGGALAARLRRREDRLLVAVPACPLMHGTGLVIGMHTPMAVGGTVVLLGPRHFDAAELWQVVETERATLVAIVGDPFARPLLRSLQEAERSGPGWDLTSLRFVSSSGAMFSAEVKAGLLSRLPGVTVLDYISATEGLMGVSISRTGDIAPTGRFRPVPGVKVFTDDDREVAAGSGEVGRVALSTGVPDAYYKDDTKSQATFRTLGDRRYSFPGDFATVEPDGSITLLGRGSQCINTGGEKVFPEEVEEVLKRHPAVEDCLVFGLPDDRFGQRVAAVALPADGPALDPGTVLGDARRSLAGYKVPRSLVVVPEVPRAANGKADYPTARALHAAGEG